VHIIKHPGKIIDASNTGLDIIDRTVISFGKKASITKINPATTLIHLLTTFVAPANPTLLDEVSTAIPSAIQPVLWRNHPLKVFFELVQNSVSLIPVLIFSGQLTDYRMISMSRLWQLQQKDIIILRSNVIPLNSGQITGIANIGQSLTWQYYANIPELVSKPDSILTASL
jgi:hypothetical protein